MPPKPLHGSGRARLPLLLAGGLLGWLGLADKEEPDPLTDTVRRAVVAGREGDLVTADRLLHIALKMAHELQHEAAVTHILCLLGQLALERGLPGQAERLYTAVLQRLLQAGEPRNSNAVCEISLKLAGILAGRGERTKAEQGYLFCIEALRPRLDAADCDEDSLALAGMALDHQAQLLLSSGRAGEAEAAWREAVLLAERLHGGAGEQTLVVRNSLASSISIQGRDSEAARLLEEVVAASRQQGPNSNLASYLVNLGLVQLKLGMMQQAGINCGEAHTRAAKNNDSDAQAEAGRCLDKIKVTLNK